MIDIDLQKRLSLHNGDDLLQVRTSIAAGAVTQVDGPSGSGKTTLLKMIAGLVRPDKGRITANGQLWLDTDRSICLPTQQRDIGFAFQDYALFPNFTVEQHLLYGSGDREYVERLLRMGQLDGFRNKRPKQLSGGQQQRLGLIRALVTRPKLLLLDEPFSALDKSLRSSIVRDLKEVIDEQQLTCLVVTHQSVAAEALIDQVLNIG